MTNKTPFIAKINVVAKNFDETLEFYRLIGLDVPRVSTEPPGVLQARANSADGAGLAIDNEALARLYNAGWRMDSPPNSVLLTVALGSRDDVDETYNKLIQAGYTGIQPPYDAFWGARYAIVLDPEGNNVGLESPATDENRWWPPTESPE